MRRDWTAVIFFYCLKKSAFLSHALSITLSHLFISLWNLYSRAYSADKRWRCDCEETHCDNVHWEDSKKKKTFPHSVLALEFRIVCALPCSSTALLKSLSRCLSAHVIEGPVAIYEEFYISGFTSKILPSLQTPQVLYSMWISLHMQQGMQFLVNTFHSVKQKE